MTCTAPTPNAACGPLGSRVGSSSGPPLKRLEMPGEESFERRQLRLGTRFLCQIADFRRVYSMNSVPRVGVVRIGGFRRLHLISVTLARPLWFEVTQRHRYERVHLRDFPLSEQRVRRGWSAISVRRRFWSVIVSRNTVVRKIQGLANSVTSDTALL